jgi:hypothetical protein
MVSRVEREGEEKLEEEPGLSASSSSCTLQEIRLYMMVY